MADTPANVANQAEAAGRQPAVLPRKVQGLEGDETAAPPSKTEPQAQPQPEPSGKEVGLQAKVDELTKAAKLKDKALEDRRREMEQLKGEHEALKGLREPGDEDANLEDRAIKKLEERSKRLAEEVKSELKPLIDEGRQARNERLKTTAIKEFGAETVEKYEAEAAETMKQHPTVSLAGAMRLLGAPSLAASKAGTETAPTTPPMTRVEGGTAKPASETTPLTEYNSLMSRSREAYGKGLDREGGELQKEAFKLKMKHTKARS